MLRRPVPRLGHLGMVVGAFAAIRVVLYAGGLRFRMVRIGRVHLLDTGYLRADPFAAFTSLHIQPPLFNFFVGAVMRWSPAPTAVSFQVLYVLMGLGTVLILWHLLVGLGARRWTATVATLLVAVNPLMIRSESILTYETPVTFLLVTTAWCADRYLRQPDVRRLAVVIGVLVVGVLTRAQLNPLWFVCAIAVLLLLRRPRGSRRAVAGCIVGGLVLVGAPIVHNGLRFHTLGLSSYTGMNLQRITVLTLPEHRLDELVDEGRLSRAAPIPPFSDFRVYAPLFGNCRPDTHDPFLRPVVKPTERVANFNSVCYLGVYDKSLEDSLAAVRADPGNYAHSVGLASMIYTSWGPYFAAPKASLWHDWVGIYQPLAVPVTVRYPFDRSDPQPYARLLADLISTQPISLSSIAALLYVLGAGISGLVRLRKRTADGSTRTRIFIAFMVLAVTLVSVSLDIFENARFREPLDPLLIGLSVVALLELVTRRIERRSGGSGSARIPTAVDQ